jgi:hypothetical protein
MLAHCAFQLGRHGTEVTLNSTMVVAFDLEIYKEGRTGGGWAGLPTPVPETGPIGGHGFGAFAEQVGSACLVWQEWERVGTMLTASVPHRTWRAAPDIAK